MFSLIFDRFAGFSLLRMFLSGCLPNFCYRNCFPRGGGVLLDYSWRLFLYVGLLSFFLQRLYSLGDLSSFFIEMFLYHRGLSIF